MGAPGDENGTTVPEAKARLLVEDAQGRRPFMRGIMVHSLMARGVGFDEAYHTASLVRDRFSGRVLVPRVEIAKTVREILGDEPFQ